jgi:signal transduction histidine kinase
MISSCHELTASLVHGMLDRARRFTKNDLHDEKLLSLGRLAAGLAHELNNPASAVASSAKELTARVLEVEASSLALGAVSLTPEQLAAIARVRAQCCDPATRAGLTPLERADREEAVAAWMARHRLPGGIGEAVAESAITVESLDHLIRSVGNDALPFALRALGAVYRARVLASEIGTAADRIEELVKAIKGFTYMDQAHDPAPLHIGKGLADTIAVLGGKARRKSVTLSLHVDNGLPLIEGFGGDLNQVWGNLIDNAIDAAPESGRIEVAASRRADKVVVRVVDDGPGIPEEKMARIFEPFFTTKPQGEGTGLGLDIARRLVRQHRGQIEVDSRPGRTEFRVLLPLARNGPPATDRPPSSGGSA